MQLRLVDAGMVSPLRSQALWHGIASAMADDAPPTLSMCRPSRPYVSLGYHRHLAEVDADACAAEGIAAGYPLGREFPEFSDGLLVALTERRSKEDIDRLAEVLERAIAQAGDRTTAGVAP